MEIKIKKINKYTNEWKTVCCPEKGGKEFSWRVSAQFTPVQFSSSREYFNMIMESNMRPTEKCILAYMMHNMFFGTTLCLYTASTLSTKLKISYRTVRTGLSNLVNMGVLFTGKIMSVQGNIGNQYSINPDFSTEDEEINELSNIYEELHKFYGPEDFVSLNDVR